MLWFVHSWIQRPESRWFFTSYAQDLATRDSVKCRRLIQSPWFQGRWGSRFRLTPDQNQKTRFENDHLGYRIASSVGGTATGERADFVVADDPHNVLEALSDTKRQDALSWWDEAISTRLNDPKRGGKVIVMQRLHQKDLAGHVLEKGGYEHLNLPMEYDPQGCVVERKHPCAQQRGTSLGFKDPRKKAGQLLSPKRHDRASVKQLKRDLGAHAAAGQLAQRPTPRGGALFAVEQFRVVRAIPGEVEASVRYWDKAGTEGGGAYSVGVRMSRLKDGRFIVEHVERGQWSAGKREKVIRQTAEIDGVEIPVKVEQEPGSGGKESAEGTVRNLAGFVVSTDRPTGDKVARADAYAVQVEAGNVLLLRGSWNSEFIEEHRSAPVGEYKDQWDASAGGFNELALGAPAFAYA